MSYVFYNPNPGNNITIDCTVRAITLLTGLDWDTVFIGLFKKAYEMKDMMDVNRVWGQYLIDMGYERKAIPDTCPFCYTVKDFCLDHPEGIYLLAADSHVVTVRNGDYYDTWDSGDKIPIYYWK
ncbi:MAG: hypothetical protein KBT27_03445 [Prevotellaceae bacterium]|nr:hypothetical protein [Candidatus Faecinaster equi]